MTIGERIKQVRSEMSQTKFAQSLDIVQRTLANYEVGKSLPNSTFLAELAKKYAISPDWLLFGEGPMRKDQHDLDQPQAEQNEQCRRCATLSAELSDSKEECRVLRAEYIKYIDGYNELNKENKWLNKEHRELTKQLLEATKEIGDLRVELERMKARAAPDQETPNEAHRKAG